MAVPMELAKEDKRVLGIAAMLHDLGKVSVLDAILNKSGPLDAREWFIVMEHSESGERVLRAAGNGLGPVADVVRHVHERWDGCGYPDGLVSTDIPLYSRIIAVCDAYCAMLAVRPHSDAISVQEARERIWQGSGSQFDPDMVDVFMQTIDGG
jgi:HD-GYP domain-containing protein (c-di-GMP phosphodiesterase class II)